MAGMTTVLSIDSGGVQGIIAAVMLEFLECQLQDLDGADARLADYFDIIAGTGSGGLTAALITTPTETKKPILAAKDLVPFYKKEFPLIFPQPRVCNGTVPVYKGNYFNQLTQKTFGTNLVSDTLTNIAIPSFDSWKLRPLIFSSELASMDIPMNAKISDVCLASLAAFPWLRAYNFKNQGQDFNTLAGAVGTANPALIAVTEAIRKATAESSKIERLLVISLGSCSAPNVGWTAASLNSMNDPNQIAVESLPMIERFTSTVNAFVVDYVLEDIFRAYDISGNYLRIFEDSLTKDMDTIDLATPVNMNNLENYARELLQKPVTRAGEDPAGPRVISEPRETYTQALQRLAISLSDYRKLRPQRA